LTLAITGATSSIAPAVATAIGVATAGSIATFHAGRGTIAAAASYTAESTAAATVIEGAGPGAAGSLFVGGCAHFLGSVSLPKFMCFWRVQRFYHNELVSERA